MTDFRDFLSGIHLNKARLLNIAIGAVIILNCGLLYGIATSLINKQTAETRIQQQQQKKVQGSIEVLNGSGKSGFNESVVSFLRRQGLDVVHYANYHADSVPSTIIVIRNGNSAPGYYIAQLLSLDSSKVVQILNKDYLLDATVIIGRDISSKKF